MADNPTLWCDLHRAVSSLVRVHGGQRLLVVAAIAGVVGGSIGRVPLPQVDTGIQDYTQAVAFFLIPLIPVPAYSATLSSVDPYERQASRGLFWYRVGLAVAGTIVAFAAQLPSALMHPAPHAVQVLIENLLAVFGLTALLGCWLRPQVAWAPVYALTLLGVTGPEQGWIPSLALVNRTVSTAGLAVSILVFCVGIALYARGPARAR